MKIISVCLLLIIFITNCTENKPTIPDYLGMPLPGDSALVFAPGIVTTIHHEHSRMEFTKDGSEMYWEVIPLNKDYEQNNESRFDIDKQNILFVKKTNSGWTNPEILPATKNMRARRPILSLDEQTLYFETDKLDADPDIRPRPSIQMSLSREDNKWTNPRKINGLIPKVEGKSTMLFCFADNGNIYYDLGGPTEKGNWAWEIYFMKYENGKYLNPVLMDNGINDEEINWCPWIAPDESYLIFSSHRKGDYGSGDLYISFNKNGQWSRPINMGEKVNTFMQERLPSVTPDGKFMFFTRHMTNTNNDFYWISSEVIEKLR